GDFLGVWVKPVDWLKFDVGRFNEDILRGKIGDDNWHSYTVAMKGKDDIFTRFKGDVGALAGLTPVEGLYIGLLVPSFAQFESNKPDHTSGAPNGNTTGDSNRALRVYERIQIGLGYEIQGIGLARVQVVGANGAKDTNGAEGVDPKTLTFSSTAQAPRFEAAFAFTGMEGLTVDFGLKFWIPIKDWLDPADTWDEDKDEYVKLEKTGTYFKGLQFALGAQYALGDLGVAARVDAKMLENYESDDGNNKYTAPLNLNFHLWPSYNLGFATLGIDFGLEVNGKSKRETPAGSTDGEEDGVRIGFGAWLKKSFGNSSIKGGLAYRAGTEFGGKKENGIFTIPIVFDYSF
ncbi:MAG: hypothetical protein LBD55_11020, partial [Treponema sp.]|nr:hypothetical protein [Treponema sp.]